MPLSFRGNGRCLHGFLWLYVVARRNALIRPAYEPAQEPIQYAENEDDLLLGTPQVKKGKVYQGHRRNHETHIEPP
jgi:hypothetical protein